MDSLSLHLVHSSPSMHINVDETEEENRMLIKVMQSKDLMSVDDFMIKKIKF